MIKEVMFYQAVCDICGNVDDGGEFSAWSTADDARMVAVEADWIEIQVRVPTTTPRGSNIYVVTRDGHEPFLERSILICPSHAERHHRGWCSTCEEDIDESGWAFSFAPNGGEAIVQRCRNGHPNAIDLVPEPHVSEEGTR